MEQPVGLMLDKSGRGNHASQSTPCNRPTLSARYNQLVGTATLATQDVTTVGQVYTLRFDGTGSITLSGTSIGTYTAGTHRIPCAAGTLAVTVTGSVTSADLRLEEFANGTIPTYQRVTTGTDYDTEGFPLYLKANGTSSTMKTNSIDFSGFMEVPTTFRSGLLMASMR